MRVRCPLGEILLYPPCLICGAVLLSWGWGYGEVPIRFVDVTSAAGIHFVHTKGFSGQYFLIESNGGGAAFFDYDGDGDLDIYLVNGFDLSRVPYRKPVNIVERVEDGFWVKARKDTNSLWDYDGKIDFDSYIPHGSKLDSRPTNALYRNNGDGTFTDVTPLAGVQGRGYGSGCVAADYDNDGDEDLYVTNYGPNILYRNNGDGTFTDVTEVAGVGHPGWGMSSAFGDYDNDGDLDLYVTNYLDATLDNNKICGGVVATKQTVTHGPLYLITDNTRSYCSPKQYHGVRDVLYRNEGDGTFTDVTRAAGLFDQEGTGMGVVFFDYNQDGYPDIFVTNDKVRNFLFQNNGDGTFTDVASIGVAYDANGSAQSCMGVDAGDYDNDGDQDLVIGNFSEEFTTLYRNEGGFIFTDVSLDTGVGPASFRLLTFGIAFGDYDNDGDLDIFAANGHVMDKAYLAGWGISYEESNQLFRNDGHGHYEEVSSTVGECFLIREVSRGLAVGDYDNDGDVDLLVTNCGGPARLFRNDGANATHWLTIKTIGTRSNRDGIGARIKVVSGSLTQVKEVRSGSSYLSSSDVRVHFGLGSRRKADVVEVVWPSGTVQTIPDVAADRVLTITEEPM